MKSGTKTFGTRGVDTVSKELKQLQPVNKIFLLKGVTRLSYLDYQLPINNHQLLTPTCQMVTKLLHIKFCSTLICSSK